MENITHLHAFEQLKTLADPRRMAILKRLMSAPATLSQLGRSLGEHPAWIRHHLKLLEQAGLVELGEVKVSDGYIEKFYRSKAQAYLLQQLILPEKPGKRMIVLSGSHDLAVELLAKSNISDMDVFILPVGSLDGLVALRQGMCSLAGCHLYDAGTGDYNAPFVRHLFPDKQMLLMTLAHRKQGLMVAQGNPHQVRGLEDLAKNLQFINRNRGSGTRLWLDEQLKRLGIPINQLRGYEKEANTHTEVAMAIKLGQADMALGIQAAAVIHQLDFIPLFQERYDLVLESDQLTDRSLLPLFDEIHSRKFRNRVQGLAGYDITHLGDQILL